MIPIIPYSQYYWVVGPPTACLARWLQRVQPRIVACFRPRVVHVQFRTSKDSGFKECLGP